MISIKSFDRIRILSKRFKLLINAMFDTNVSQATIADISRKMSPIVVSRVSNYIDEYLQNASSGTHIYKLPANDITTIIDSWPPTMCIFFDVLGHIPRDMIRVYILYGYDICKHASTCKFLLFKAEIEQSYMQESVVPNRMYFDKNSFPSHEIGEA